MSAQWNEMKRKRKIILSTTNWNDNANHLFKCKFSIFINRFPSRPRPRRLCPCALRLHRTSHRIWMMNGPQLRHKYRLCYQWRHHHCQKKTIRYHLMPHLINHWMIKSNFSRARFSVVVVAVVVVAYISLLLCCVSLVLQFSFPFFILCFACSVLLLTRAYHFKSNEEKRKEKRNR